MIFSLAITCFLSENVLYRMSHFFGADPLGTRRRVCISEKEKNGGLRNRAEMFGTGPDSWRTHTMGLGGGPQGSNLFPQAGSFSSSRKLDLRKEGNKVAKNFTPHFSQ